MGLISHKNYAEKSQNDGLAEKDINILKTKARVTNAVPWHPRCKRGRVGPSGSLPGMGPSGRRRGWDETQARRLRMS